MKKNLKIQLSDNQQKRIETEKKGSYTSEILMIEKYIQFLKQRMKLQLFIIEKIQEDVIKKQNELLEIVKEKKSLEIYKEKKFSEYQNELMRVEQNFLDELAIRKYHA